MKLPGIRPVPIEFEVGRKATAEPAQPLQQVLTAGLAGDDEFSRVGNMNFDLIAFRELKRLDHRGGKANRKTVAPFGDLHGALLGYTRRTMYIQGNVPSRIGLSVLGAFVIAEPPVRHRPNVQVPLQQWHDGDPVFTVWHWRWTSYRLSSLVWAGFADVVSKVTARYEIASVNRPGAKNHDPARN
jgi:hypothetical protein